MSKLLQRVSVNARWVSGFRAVSKWPQPQEVDTTNAVFDEITHTGQAWDKSDYRLQRFDFAKKLVNPNIAQKMVAELSPLACEDRITYCDGGHGALGHPRVYINLDKPGNHACGYCGKRFYNPHVTKGDDRNINHYNC